MVWWLLGFAIAAEVFATSSLRAATDADPSWPWWTAAGLGYVVALGLFAVALSKGAPLAISYAIWAGVGVALTALIAAVVFADKLNAGVIAGIVLVVIGVVLIEWFANA